MPASRRASAAALGRRQRQHDVLKGRLRGDELPAHGAALGGVQLLADPAEQVRLHLLQRPHRLLRPALVDQQHDHVELGRQRVRMARAEHLAASLQRLAIERLRLAVAALRLVENGQVVEAGQRVRMARAEGLAAPLQRLLIERLRLAVAALRLVENGQVVEADERVRMAGPSISRRPCSASLKSGSASP